MSRLFMQVMRQQQSEMKTFLLQFPRTAGRIARDEFVNNFKKQGYTDQAGVFHPWPPRKVRRYHRRGVTGKKKSRLKLTKAGRQDKGRAILVGLGSGKLRRDINIGQITTDSVTVTTSSITKDYAQVHNEGLKAGRGKGFRMTRRAFMTDSKNIDDKVNAFITNGLNKIFRV